MIRVGDRYLSKHNDFGFGYVTESINGMKVNKSHILGIKSNTVFVVDEVSLNYVNYNIFLTSAEHEPCLHDGERARVHVMDWDIDNHFMRLYA